MTESKVVLKIISIKKNTLYEKVYETPPIECFIADVKTHQIILTTLSYSPFIVLQNQSFLGKLMMNSGA